MEVDKQGYSLFGATMRVRVLHARFREFNIFDQIKHFSLRLYEPNKMWFTRPYVPIWESVYLDRIDASFVSWTGINTTNVQDAWSMDKDVDFV